MQHLIVLRVGAMAFMMTPKPGKKYGKMEQESSSQTINLMYGTDTATRLRPSNHRRRVGMPQFSVCSPGENHV
jgi:hypothetical protein